MKQSLKKNGMPIYVKNITSTGLELHLNNEDFFIPFIRVPWFQQAKVEDVFNVRMNGLDEIRWDKLDIDLDVNSLKYPEKYPLIMKPYIIKDEQTTAVESEIKYNK